MVGPMQQAEDRNVRDGSLFSFQLPKPSSIRRIDICEIEAGGPAFAGKHSRQLAEIPVGVRAVRAIEVSKKAEFRAFASISARIKQESRDHATALNELPRQH